MIKIIFDSGFYIFGNNEIKKIRWSDIYSNKNKTKIFNPIKQSKKICKELNKQNKSFIYISE